MKTLPPVISRLMAYCIAGHHSGLLDAGAGQADVPGNLAHRLAKTVCSVDCAPRAMLESVIPKPLPMCWLKGQTDAGFQLAMLGRMLFSCLVDADFLATEEFLKSDVSQTRRTPLPDWAGWAQKVDEVVAAKQQKVSAVNTHRADVYRRCLEAANDPPGLFSLTVPTGGGKTLASFAFALRHAQKHGLRHIVCALPYTSIIEQNVRVLRDVLGPDGDRVLEHHSNLDPATETNWSRLASENWDAPVVVTTNVQFFESLFACRTSRCRKLHRLARSIIILDEAQTLPVELLRPCLAVLAELVRNYETTIVLCTATQPALVKRDDFAIGLEGVREIVADPAGLYNALRRVHVDSIGELSTAALVQRLVELPQVLCIVEKRSRAADVYRAVIAHGVEAVHLSAAMCPAHRSSLIEEIKRRLAQGEPCRVISTQLIEAGVDVDFPVVYRALAGLDAIAQAAGRCNREGKLAVGQVYVFIPEGGINAIPPGHLRQTAATTAELLPGISDLLNPDLIRQYFELHYWKRQYAWDKHSVMECFSDARDLNFDYATAAERFKMIADDQRPVVVPWGTEGERVVKRLLNAPHADRELVRSAQRFAVQIPRRIWDALVVNDEIDPLPDAVPVLLSSHRYDQDLGFLSDMGLSLPVETCVI